MKARLALRTSSATLLCSFTRGPPTCLCFLRRLFDVSCHLCHVLPIASTLSSLRVPPPLLPWRVVIVVDACVEETLVERGTERNPWNQRLAPVLRRLAHLAWRCRWIADVCHLMHPLARCFVGRGTNGCLPDLADLFQETRSGRVATHCRSDGRSDGRTDGRACVRAFVRGGWTGELTDGRSKGRTVGGRWVGRTDGRSELLGRTDGTVDGRTDVWADTRRWVGRMYGWSGAWLVGRSSCLSRTDRQTDGRWVGGGRTDGQGGQADGRTVGRSVGQSNGRTLRTVGRTAHACATGRSDGPTDETTDCVVVSWSANAENARGMTTGISFLSLLTAFTVKIEIALGRAPHNQHRDEDVTVLELWHSFQEHGWCQGVKDRPQFVA